MDNRTTFKLILAAHKLFSLVVEGITEVTYWVATIALPSTLAATSKLLSSGNGNISSILSIAQSVSKLNANIFGSLTSSVALALNIIKETGQIFASLERTLSVNSMTHALMSASHNITLTNFMSGSPTLAILYALSEYDGDTLSSMDSEILSDLDSVII